jgi:hypothetical protein
MSTSKQAHTADQIKQVEFLRESLLNDLANQDNQYKDLSTKITFLFGFSVTVLTLYGTYAKDVNSITKWLALGLFTITLILLCLAYSNHNFNKPARLDTQVNKSNYFSKVYQEVSNIKKACTDNDSPLKDMAQYTRWSIYTFTLGIIFLIASFML